eukprot:4507679-Prymnesium_polylepis.1
MVRVHHYIRTLYRASRRLTRVQFESFASGSQYKAHQHARCLLSLDLDVGLAAVALAGDRSHVHAVVAELERFGLKNCPQTLNRQGQGPGGSRLPRRAAA